jgi:hypothetical protein
MLTLNSVLIVELIPTTPIPALFVEVKLALYEML